MDRLANYCQAVILHNPRASGTAAAPPWVPYGASGNALHGVNMRVPRGFVNHSFQEGTGRGGRRAGGGVWRARGPRCRGMAVRRAGPRGAAAGRPAAGQAVRSACTRGGPRYRFAAGRPRGRVARRGGAGTERSAGGAQPVPVPGASRLTWPRDRSYRALYIRRSGVVE